MFGITGLLTMSRWISPRLAKVFSARYMPMFQEDINRRWEPFTNYFDGALMIRAELDSVNALGLEDDLSGNIPVSFGLNQNYPNPFNPTTTIEFDLASKGYASLTIYDLTGREVMDLVNQNLDAGHYAFKLNAVDLPSGMYFYQLIANNDTGDQIYSSTKKLILMK
jgi:hypothetical protein